MFYMAQSARGNGYTAERCNEAKLLKKYNRIVIDHRVRNHLVSLPCYVYMLARVPWICAGKRSCETPQGTRDDLQTKNYFLAWYETAGPVRGYLCKCLLSGYLAEREQED